MAGICLGGFRFITLAKTSIAWLRKELDRHKGDIVTIKNRRTELSCIYCYTEMLTHTFEKTRKYASRKKGLEKGSVETFDKRIYLHLYFNPIKKENDDNSFYSQMAKEDADASKPRIWYADHLMGQMMVQFIALAYEDYLRYRIGKMKAELGKENGNPLHDTKEKLAAEQNLKIRIVSLYNHFLNLLLINYSSFLSFI